MGSPTTVSGPDFSQGVPLADIPERAVLSGHVGDTPVLLAKVGSDVHAVSATCTHYSAALGGGLRVGDEIRCPWHHACFSLRTGQALKAPALAPLDCWKVVIADGKAFVHERDSTPASTPALPSTAIPKRIVLIGGGAAAFACAKRLRERGFDGQLSMLSADPDAPCDRPNLSKDYLAGSAPEAWIPLQAPEAYIEQQIDLRLGCEVSALDIRAKRVTTRNGDHFDYDALLLATGAEPVQIPLPRFDRSNVYRLRSLGDARGLIAGLAGTRSVALIGAGFIGMESAAALRARGLDVHVIAPEALPLERLLGRELAEHLTGLHRQHGVNFHLDCQVQQFDGRVLSLSNGQMLEVDSVLVGVGVRPRIALAEQAKLKVQNGIVVDAQLRTSAADVYAAGDVARYPHADGLARVEHWVHAQRQGQCVADNMLGDARTFNDPPFFWTHHYGIDLRYLGHGQGWTSTHVDGNPANNDCLVRYFRDGQLLAAAALGRDRALLALEAELR